jgi:two-component system response regulator MprA
MPKRILIAEDEDTAREALAQLATMQGYDVTAVSNGVDLLSLAAKERFDVVITDLKMKDLDGVSAANIMKMQGDTTPFIALTGVSADDLQFLQDSFTKIFYKPVNISELFQYVDTLIGSANVNP